MQSLLQDLRHAARVLLKKPGFTLTAALTLALGIGATTSIFSVVYATLYEAMPYPKPDQLMMVWTKRSNGRDATSAGDYHGMEEAEHSLFNTWKSGRGGSFNVATAERPEQVDGVFYTPDFFRMTGNPYVSGPRFPA